MCYAVLIMVSFSSTRAVTFFVAAGKMYLRSISSLSLSSLCKVFIKIFLISVARLIFRIPLGSLPESGWQEFPNRRAEPEPHRSSYESPEAGQDRDWALLYKSRALSRLLPPMRSLRSDRQNCVLPRDR